MSRVYVFPLLLICVLAGRGIGQDTPADQPPPRTESAPRAAEPPAAKPAAAKPAAAQPAAGEPAAAKPAGVKEKEPDAGKPAAKPPLRQEHIIIYVPFKNLRDVFEKGDSSIVLPYAQFLEMWNRLVRPDQAPVQPPVNGVITRADYAGAVKGELVQLEATLDVEVLSAE